MRNRRFLLLPWVCIAAACGGGASNTVAIRDQGSSITLVGSRARVVVTRDPFRLAFSAPGGEEVSEASRGLFFVADGERVFLDRVESIHGGDGTAALTVSSPRGDATLSISFPSTGVARVSFRPPDAAHATAAGERLDSPTGESIYGLAERAVTDVVISEIFALPVGGLDRRGTTVSMKMEATVALFTPFFQTSRGYGVFVEGTAIGRYDLARADANVIEYEFEIPKGRDSLDYRFLAGPTPADVLDRYTAISGRPFLPPAWTFKHWRWRDEHRNGPPATLDGVAMNADLVDDLTHYESLGIPVGNYTIDRPWGAGDLPNLRAPEDVGFGDLYWDEDRFPNPEAMIEALTRRGYHLFLWVAPWATGVTTNREATANGYLAPSSRYIIDYTNPAAAAWWEEKMKALVRRGIAGFKIDRGDEDTPSADSDVYWDGRTGSEIKNAYPEIMAKVHHDAVKAVRGDDFLNYPRAGYAGSQRWAGFSAGDVPGKNLFGTPTDAGLRLAILAMQNAALMGFPIWGSDTGGYEQFGDREVFARWLEFSAFSPIMEIGGSGTHAPWDMPTEPRIDTEMIDIYRRFVTIHHALVPYLYAHAVEAHRAGKPIAKPLWFAYPEDTRVRDAWDEFLLGDDILVAPVWKLGTRTRDVYLPAGAWVDHWDRSRVVEGPKELRSEPAPFDRIPVFVRAGADVLGTF